MSAAAQTLAPDGIPPTEGADADEWRALLATADRLFGSGVIALGPPTCIDATRVERLAAEADEVRPSAGDGRAADPGPELRGLAVDRRLRAELSEALGQRVVPGYVATYLFDRPGSEVRLHVDSEPYELTFHIVLSHHLPADGTGGSALIAYLPAGTVERICVAPGEAVLLRGLGTIHRWEPLKPDEERVLIAVAFRAAQ